MKQGIEGIKDDEIRTACNAILASDAFMKAHRMQRLLRFLVEQAITGESRNTNEYAIGIEVFDREPARFVPAEDPIVRVQVGRLRQRLEVYYAAHEPPDGIEIRVPVGTYMPAIRRWSIAKDDPEQSRLLMVQPIHYIAERGDGQAFAHGLYEELLEQLFKSFGTVFMAPGAPPEVAGGRATPPRRLGAHHCIESSVRIDAQRIRASIRLVDPSLRRITWARNFDRAIQFGIDQQEELATCICSALRQRFLR
ncbi:hypothetical protein [Paracidovorax anthurii]|uniref:TolB-like protein n=1 Tax=Paracidovorax anthurii TaxID=78229 RepID=A0A328YU96_9BURK|nr:hypothetical protein [Paracidovorax anthurii]RAR77538.1 TolB-like protein [Paracidovorax anthurii]